MKKNLDYFLKNIIINYHPWISKKINHVGLYGVRQTTSSSHVCGSVSATGTEAVFSCCVDGSERAST